MMNFEKLLNEPIPQSDLGATRRDHFSQANASQALDGLEMDDDDRFIQERVIRGELNTAQAVAEYRLRAKRSM